MSKRQMPQQPAAEPVEEDEDPDEVTKNAIAAYEASKVYALRGTPAYLVTLATPSGNTTVRGLDERPLDAIVRELGGAGGIGGSVPKMVLRGAEQLVNFGCVVARPDSVVSISSFIENYAVEPDDGDTPEDGDDDDDDTGSDGDGDGDGDGDDDDEDTKVTRLQHPMLGS